VRWGLASALVFVLVAAGCGAGGALALDPVASAADRTLDKQTAHFDLSVEVKEPQTGRAVTFTGHGAFDDSQQAVGMTFDFPDLGTDAPDSMELRLLFPVMYMHFNGLPAGEQLPNGKNWVKIDLQRQLRKLGVNLQQLAMSGNQSPTDALAQLRGSKHAKKLGTETIDGVETTHYRVKVDLNEALARATPKERKAVQRLLRTAKENGFDAAGTSVDVWVGDDGLVRRLSEKLGRVGKFTMTFSDYGEPVQIEAPPPDETVDFSALLSG
jgi:hypothetical protein